MLLVVDVTRIVAATTDMAMHRDLAAITACGSSFFCAAAAVSAETMDAAADAAATASEMIAACGSSFFCAAVVDGAANYFF